MSEAESSGGDHVCPWWVGYLLVCPLRRLVENPRSLLGPHVRAGMTVLEPGCGMGYFSLPLARMVGPRGRVLCVDLQARMIDRLARRARRAGLADRIDAWVCAAADLRASRWNGKVDLATAIHVIHEVPDAAGFLTQVHSLLRAGGRLLILEPKGHVSRDAFARTVDEAVEAGFRALSPPGVKRDRAALLEKPPGDPE